MKKKRLRKEIERLQHRVFYLTQCVNMLGAGRENQYVVHWRHPGSPETYSMWFADSMDANVHSVRLQQEGAEVIYGPARWPLEWKEDHGLYA